MEGNADRYEQLRKKLSRWPVKLPASPEVIPILQILFEPEEVDLLLSEAFSAPYQDKKTVKLVAEELGKHEAEIEKALNNLADRGLLFRVKNPKNGDVYYSLFPILPGIFEFYLVGEHDEKRRTKFSTLFEEYYQNMFVTELGASEHPWVRVLPAEKNFQVDIELDPTMNVLSFEKVSEYVKTSHKIALMECACRLKSPCDHPLETCMCFDYYADYMVDRKLARYLEHEEAIEVLKQFEEKGLVHTTTNCQKRPQFICNCCTCSCLVLRGLTEFDNPRCFVKSNFIPEWVSDNCNMCELCIAICPMNAVSVSESLNEGSDEGDYERLVFNEDKCIGCGLCASNCEVDAITLTKVRDYRPETTLRGMWLRTEMERIDDKSK
ncbi:MAG: 4Fe-4S dicluster domain-containing protein [Thermoplasmata archaeon]|nr:MAG: 4Fe-4S dicluster domain-containing protein [Thermoplasmata archaeon]